MTHALRLAFAVTFATLAVLALAAPVSARTVIYYDDAGGDTDGITMSNMFLNMIGHFDPDVSTAPIDEFAGAGAGDFVVYIGHQDESGLSDDFLETVVSGEVRTLWIYNNFWKLAEVEGSEAIGFSVDDWIENDGRDAIRYGHHTVERKIDLSYYNVNVTGEHVKVHSTLTSLDGAEQRPHFLCGNNVCFLSEMPFFAEGVDERLFVLADCLHEFYETGAPAERLAMIRVEDLSPGFVSPTRLVALADELAARDVPFGFGVIPVTRDPIGLYFGGVDTTLTLADDPDFLIAIDHMMARGGTMAMHGYTHQNGDGITAHDWEFVENLDNDPLPQDSGDWVRDRVTKGLAELWSEGYEPLIWETPHYGASHGAFGVFAEYFDTYWDRPLIFPFRPGAEGVFGEDIEPLSQIVYQYTPVSVYGMGIIPETLGLIDPADVAGSAQAMLDRAERMTIIRDGVASFFFHHGSIENEDILALVDEFLDRGYRFVSPEEYAGDDGMDGQEAPEDFGDEDAGDDDDDDSGGCGW
ncbi:DUF2334 domain-containing protein [bacterium]|nr:DUF2334 domain-containing protein [bacterium]